jgi:outer membrane protein, multidrug efflux system
MNRRRSGVAIVCAAALAAASGLDAPAEDAPDRAWWTAWNDPALTAWIEAALDAHPTLDAAAAAVRRARAARAESAAARRPGARAELAGRLGRERSMRTDGRDDDIQPLAAGAELQWELDLFGRIGDRTAATESLLAAAEADRRGVELALAADVAMVYVELGRIEAELPLAGALADAARERAAIMTRRAGAGLAAEAEADALRAEADAMERALHRLRREQAELEALRTALLPEGPPRPPAALADLVLPPVPDAQDGARALRRPDIVRLYARLDAAGAAARAERKERWPTVALIARAMGEGGRDGDELSEWNAWVGPRVEIPLGDPRLRPARERAEAEREGMAAETRAALLDAARDIDAALAARRQAGEDLRLAVNTHVALRRAAGSAARRADAGLGPRLESLMDEMRALAAERDALQSRAAAHEAHLRLLRALGG